MLAEVKALVDAPTAQWPQRLQPLVTEMADGRIKLYTIWQSLALRARWPEVFRDGDYLPLTVSGAAAIHVCAFARRHAGRNLIAVVPRLPARLLGDRHAQPVGMDVWGDTAIELPEDLAELAWDNVLAGEHHPASRKLALGQLLNYFPVALLVAENKA